MGAALFPGSTHKYEGGAWNISTRIQCRESEVRAWYTSSNGVGMPSLEATSLSGMNILCYIQNKETNESVLLIRRMTNFLSILKMNAIWYARIYVAGFEKNIIITV